MHAGRQDPHVRLPRGLAFPALMAIVLRRPTAGRKACRDCRGAPEMEARPPRSPLLPRKPVPIAVLMVALCMPARLPHLAVDLYMGYRMCNNKAMWQGREGHRALVPWVRMRWRRG